MLSGDDLAISLFLLSLAFGLGLEAVKAETTLRRIIFTALCSTCCFAGLFWIQIKNIWPPLTEAVSSVGTNPLAWFIVLMFILAVFAFHRPKLVGANHRPIRAITNPSVSQRISVNVSPKYLTDLYKGRTSLQADALAANYKGKWLSVVGEVADISRLYNDSILVMIQDDGKLIAANFVPEKREIISHISHGSTITVTGEISEINSYSLKLENCELG
jgi:hypothetical protein